MHHEGGREERRGEVDHGDDEDHGDQQPGGIDRSGVPLLQPLHFRFVMVAHRGELEIFAAEEIGVGRKEDQEAKAEDQDERQRDRVDQKNDAEESNRGDDGGEERLRAAGRVGG